MYENKEMRRNILTWWPGGKGRARKLHEHSFIINSVLRSGALGFLDLVNRHGHDGGGGTQNI
jgi:hypothetical protein